jgi:hypothetical protein
VAAPASLPSWPMPRRVKMLGVALTWAGMIAFCLAAWYIIVYGLIALLG